MFTELGKSDYKNLLPLLHSVPRDPMLYMLLEGNRPGRIFADHSSHPSVVLIWSGMEYGYLIGDSGAISSDIVGVVENIILPFLNEIGLDFITIFPFAISPTEVQGWFPKRRPVSYGVNAFTFEQDRFERQLAKTKPLPPGYNLTRLDRDTLNQSAYQGIQEDILFCWESLDQFIALGLGYSIENDRNRVVSACYAIGYGANAYHIDIWTHPEHRLKGLARNAATAFLNECLQENRTIYWINDAPNIASRRLAESLGFVHTGDLATVDIPVHPYHFHLSLAEHFVDYLGLYQGAGELYDMAFDIQEGSSEAYRKAAQVWQQVGDDEKAEKYEQMAA